jgi:hypothetical protein
MESVNVSKLIITIISYLKLLLLHYIITEY